MPEVADDRGEEGLFGLGASCNGARKKKPRVLLLLPATAAPKEEHPGTEGRRGWVKVHHGRDVVLTDGPL